MGKIPHGQAYLYCTKCKGEFSAVPGDYWDAPNEVEAGCCGVAMKLCIRGGRFEGDAVLPFDSSVVTIGDLRRLVTNVDGQGVGRRKPMTHTRP